MKKINIKYLAVATLVLLGLSSCLDEEGVFKEDGSNSIVELTLPARTTSTPYAVKSTTLELVDEFTLPVEINFTGVNGAPSDVQVTLAIDDNIVSAYDTSGATLALPTANYELPTSNTVTIAKGEKKATFNIKLKPRSFNPTKSYALGIKIVGTSVGTISGNYSAGVYILPVKSPWQGTYNVHRKWLYRGGVETGEVSDKTGVKLTTVAPGVVQTTPLGGLYSGYSNYTHQLDGTISVYAYSGGGLAVEVFNSSYDLENLTFQVEYSFISPTRYRIIETYTKTGD